MRTKSNELTVICGLTATALLLSVAGCSAPQYDQLTDETISNLHQTVDKKISDLILLNGEIRMLSSKQPITRDEQKELVSAKNAISYNSNIDFYSSVDSGLEALSSRVNATPDLSTPKVGATLVKLRSILVDPSSSSTGPTSMQAVHFAQGTLGPAFLMSTRTQVDANFETLTLYELTRKSGATVSCVRQVQQIGWPRVGDVSRFG